MAYEDITIGTENAGGGDTPFIAWTKSKAMFQELYSLGINLITGTDTLDETDFGKVHFCTGTSADYNVTLPAVSGNSGKMIMFKGGSNASLTKVVTILQNSADTIDGETSRPFSAYGEIWLLCDGTNWIVVNEVGSWIPWTPTYTGFTTPPTGVGRYRRQGKMYTIELISGAATSTQTFFTVTLPSGVTPKQALVWPMQASNNGAGITGRAAFTASSNVVTLTTSPTGAAWTASSTKSCYLIQTFEAE